MIPKIIHYCWFGGNPMPKKFKKNINKWKNNLPDYEFVLWNESTFNIYNFEFTKKAYEQKKFAFVSDFVRLYALINFGGVYLDIDMEFVSRFDELLNKDVILGFEVNNVTTGFISSSKNNEYLVEIFDKYYLNNEFKMVPNTQIFTDYFFNNKSFDYKKSYFYDKYTIYSFYYFCCNDLLNVYINKNSKFIHRYSASWFSIKDRIKSKIHVFLIKIGILKK